MAGLRQGLEPAGGVAKRYVHQDKLAVPGPGLVLAGARLKWYAIQPRTAGIASAVRAQARAFLTAEVAAGRLRLDRRLGFVLLHRCGPAFFYLVVCAWCRDNELEKAAYMKDAGGAFQPAAPDGHRFCVWELGVVGHERAAWTRYLGSRRDDRARRTYLGDRFSGPV